MRSKNQTPVTIRPNQYRLRGLNGLRLLGHLDTPKEDAEVARRTKRALEEERGLEEERELDDIVGLTVRTTGW